MARFSFRSEQSDENQRAFEIHGGEHVSDPVAVLAPVERPPRVLLQLHTGREYGGSHGHVTNALNYRLRPIKSVLSADKYFRWSLALVLLQLHHSRVLEFRWSRDQPPGWRNSCYRNICYCIFLLHFGSWLLGTVSRGKTAVLLDFVQIKKESFALVKSI